MTLLQLINEIKQRNSNANIASSANDMASQTPRLAKLAILAPAANPDAITQPIASSYKKTINLKLKQDNNDTRRYCFQCSNLTRSGQCLSAKRGELSHTSRTYQPVINVLRHCDSYYPGAEHYEFVEVKAQSDLFESFFIKAEHAGLMLLADDKRWLKSLGYAHISEELFNQYTQCWIDAMSDEKIAFKKQNKGRFVANTFIREACKNDQ